jgi:hypothetical protein
VALEQARGLTAFNGFLVFLFRLFLLLYDALDETIAYEAPEGDDGTGFVEWKGVFCSRDSAVIGRIDERLGKPGAGRRVAYLSLGGEGYLGKPRRYVDRSVCWDEVDAAKTGNVAQFNPPS